MEGENDLIAQLVTQHAESYSDHDRLIPPQRFAPVL
jgi:hypothetical protein